MSQDKVVSLIVDMMGVTMKVALPMLLVGLIVGLLISILQAVTQIQEQTLSFIPKILGMVAVIAIAGPWMLARSSTGRPSSGRRSRRTSGADPMTANEVLARFSEQQVAAFFLVLARVSPLFILAPLFSSKMIPGRVRTIIAVGLAVGLMPVVKHGPIDLDPLAFGGMIVKEVVVGLSFAYALAAMFAGAAGRRFAAGHADRVLVRLAGRPGHGQPVDRHRRSSTRCSASRS